MIWRRTLTRSQVQPSFDAESCQAGEVIKEKSLEELKTMAKERVADWNKAVGSVSTQEYVMMSKQWDIPVDDIIDKRITPRTDQGNT